MSEQINELISSIKNKLKGKKIAVAESCTGGMLSAYFTNIPGVSDFFLGGVVSYSNELKKNILGVQKESLKKYGAVSSQVAKEMALGCLKITGADISISITGIAGPGAAAAGKPIGLVYFAAVVNGEVSAYEKKFTGDRAQIREKACYKALEIILSSTQNL